MAPLCDANVESTTTTNGEVNRPRNTNQLEAAARRSNNDYVERAPHQIKTAVAINRHSRA